MALDKIIKLLESNNKEDCTIGYRLLRRRYRYLFLWMINIIILRKYDIFISIIHFPDLNGASDETYIHISSSNQSWIQIN